VNVLPLPAVANNLFIISGRITDTLWNGLYVDDALMVLDFHLKLAAMLGQIQSRINSEILSQSIWRTVLYILSRPVDSVPAQHMILDCLTVVSAHRNLLYGSTTTDGQFVVCLAHLLFMLTITPDFDSVMQCDRQLERASAQVALAACRVWNELYNAKKGMLEATLHVTIVAEPNAARALLAQSASTHWLAFVDLQVQTRSTPSAAKQLPQQFQSKISKMTSGLQRLTSRKGLAASGSSALSFMNRQSSNSGLSKEIVQMWMRVHHSLLRELVRVQCTRYHEWHAHLRKWCLQEWQGIEQELT